MSQTEETRAFAREVLMTCKYSRQGYAGWPTQEARPPAIAGGRQPGAARPAARPVFGGVSGWRPKHSNHFGTKLLLPCYIL